MPRRGNAPGDITTPPHFLMNEEDLVKWTVISLVAISSYLGFSRLFPGSAPPEESEDRSPLPEEAPPLWHEILEVPADAPWEKIVARYELRFRHYHPDRVAHLGPEYVRMAESKIRELQDALRAAALQHGRSL